MENDATSALFDVPFRLLDVGTRPPTLALSASCPYLALRSTPSLPGLVATDDADVELPFSSQVQSLRRSPSSLESAAALPVAPTPQELAILILSRHHYAVHAVRIVFHKIQRPSKVELLVASTVDDDGTSDRHDAVTLYLSASFRRLVSVSLPPPSVVGWQTPSALSLSLPPSSNVRHCAFLRLLLFPASSHPENPRRRVTIKSLQLLGSLRAHGAHARSLPPVRSPSPSTVEPVDVDDDSEALRELFAKHGVRDDQLLSRLIERSPTVAPPQPPESPPTSRAASRVNAASKSLRPSPEASASLTPDALDPLDSIFDQAMRAFVHARARQHSLLQSIGLVSSCSCCACCSCSSSSESRRLQLLLPSISAGDPRRHQAIVVHTFGAFFAQCLLHGGGDDDDDSAELQAFAVQLAERLSPVLVPAGMPPALVVEGLVAVIALGLGASRSRSVLHATLHLVRSLFQCRSPAGEAEAEADWVTATPRGLVTTRLRAVLDAVLASPRLWARPTRLATTRVDREWLLTLRLLLDQSKTSSSLITALVPLEDAEEEKPARVNRLRSLRWVLQQRQAGGITSEQATAVRGFCQRVMQEDNSSTQRRLATECLALLSRSDASAKPIAPASRRSLDVHLASLRRHLQRSESEEAATETADERARRQERREPSHTPLSHRFPLSAKQRDALVRRTTQYFALHARPDALYSHAFTVESVEGHNGAFERGNISFRGLVQPRQVPAPDASFHERLQRATQPFTFDERLVRHETAVHAPFARFRGTLEPRTEPPAPEQVRARTLLPAVQRSRWA
ncbi:hypothetical protein P43SY_005477 [Pythium insidiosum]|uniref:Uncharacterized protein n=1 Tax=Pythium insidiosum TaxID=114742 RepID=A0AAD5LH03_PYTIN|nr:hypothetical protein P43SY_005477 [Pythium insidiosum]